MMSENGFEQKARDAFGEVCIDKELFIKSGLLERSIPTFVAEWIIDRFSDDKGFNEDTRLRINSFIDEHLPKKDQKEAVKNRLSNGESMTILDRFVARVDLKKNLKLIEIPSIDEDGFVKQSLLDEYENLLGGGMWGAGKLVYHPPVDDRSLGEIWLHEFRPMQLAHLDLDYVRAARSEFTTSEWRQLMVNSMGYNPRVYTPAQQLLLLTRILPIVQQRVNLIELAPKGTGKSFIFQNLSKYARIISGGKITAAVLFYNNSTNTPGLLSQYDAVVFDEAQTISFDNPGEIVGILKDFLESGKYSRGKQQVTSDAGIVILGNIPIGADNKPMDDILFHNLPLFLQETAFIDRLHGILPGWELPRITTSSPANGIGFKADFFAEYLHALREESIFSEYVNSKMQINGTNDMRDVNAIRRLTTGYLKLLFPNLNPSEAEFLEYCIKPSIKLRQSVRDQLSKLDAEYKTYTIYGEVT